MGKLQKNTLTVVGSVLFTLLLAEAVLHFFPVNEGLRTQPVNSDHPIAHFQPNRTSTWSRFADFSMANTVHANNFGFINDQDYAPKGELPVIAVIGDSYVEAAMVPYPRTLQGRLARFLKGAWRVYSFGISGAPLSQYLAMARFAREEFKPSRMIFVIVGNDFDESLLRYKSTPGFHYFTGDTADALSLTRIDYAPSPVRSLLRHSRLAMYLATNLNAAHTVSSLWGPREKHEYVGQTMAAADPERLRYSKLAVDAFLENLPEFSGLAPKDILIVVDAMRPHIYSDGGMRAAAGSYFDRMRRYLLASSERHGFGTIDMTTPFSQDYGRDKTRFEFPHDGHWNGRGHAVAFQAVRDYHGGEFLR